MVQYQISMDTVAGKVKYKIRLKLKMNKLNLISNLF